MEKEKRDTVMSVYKKVMECARDFRESSKSEGLEKKERDILELRANELYWVGGLLENTEEVNPVKK